MLFRPVVFGFREKDDCHLQKLAEGAQLFWGVWAQERRLRTRAHVRRLYHRNAPDPPLGCIMLPVSIGKQISGGKTAMETLVTAP